MLTDNDWLQAIHERLTALERGMDKLTAAVYIVAFILAFIAVFVWKHAA